MRSINNVILVGHLAADPEQSTMPSGRARVTFPVATYRETTSDGAKKDVTDYHRVATWGKLAETCGKYLRKGQGVYVEGRVLNRAYEKEGQRRYVTEIHADEVSLLTWRKRSGVTNVTLETPTDA